MFPVRIGWTALNVASRRLTIGFAVDRRQAARSIGSALVKDALRRCRAGAGSVGGRVVVFCAIDAEAEPYWQSSGFMPARDNSLVLLSSDDIRVWLAQA